MTKKESYQKFDTAWGARPVPETPKESLLEMFYKTVAACPDKPASIFLDHPTTYRELDELSDRFAMFLIRSGVQKGDRVATMLPNCTQHIILFFAALKAGAILVPMNVMLKAAEAEYILHDCGARILIVLDLVYPQIQSVTEPLGISTLVTAHPKDFSGPGAVIPPMLAGEKQQIETAIDFQTIISEPSEVPPKPECDPDEDLAMILYTSGTTGFPKGVMITHYNFNAATVLFSSVIGVTDDDVFFMLFPLFHIAGYVLILLPAVYLGATVVPIPVFDPVQSLNIIQNTGITRIFAPPTGYIALLGTEGFSDYDLSSLRFTLAGSTPVPAQLQKEWEAKTGLYLYNGWGASEVTGVAPGIVEMANRKRMGGETLGSVMGELKIVDKDGGIVPRGSTGEFLLRGPGVVKGYWKKPDKTREEFTEDGWWRSGDVGYMDDEGFVYFVERMKDLIIASGYNVAPVEVENHLYRHEAVLEAAVIGVPDDYRGETIKACLVIKEAFRDSITPEDILQYCSKNMAAYKAPKLVEFLPELPKTATGKILRRVLREVHRPN